ncbi:hypothetical protein [Neorhizobium sp. IRS_2294]|uniref:hypothetical protein n=1 Tax=unclassified Neorhizobium TaxID=2629175 RepID=UPI003D2B6D28
MAYDLAKINMTALMGGGGADLVAMPADFASSIAIGSLSEQSQTFSSACRYQIGEGRNRKYAK